MNLMEEELTKMIIGAYYNVYNKLGYGFLEKVYEKSMLIELKKLGLKAITQQAIQVFYEDEVVGNYYADIVVEGKVILELKAASTLTEEHEIQLMNYLKATDIEVGLLLNFGKKPKFSRKVFQNKNK